MRTNIVLKGHKKNYHNQTHTCNNQKRYVVSDAIHKTINGLTMKPFLPPSRQWKRLLLAWKRNRPLSLWKS